MRDAFLADLKRGPLPDVISKWVMERNTPVVFGDDVALFRIWKATLAQRLSVDPHALIVVGSACVGFSLHPEKNLKLFSDGSDIDVAVVSTLHFEQAWYHLRTLGSNRHRYSDSVRENIDLHATTYVYWGTIATDMILGVLPFGTEWLTAIGEMSKVPPTDSRDVNLRLYRDFHALRAYQLRSISKLRQKVMGIQVGNNPA